MTIARQSGAISVVNQKDEQINLKEMEVSILTTLTGKQIVEDVLYGKYKGVMLLNVNIPKLPLDEIKGVALCHQAKGRWVEEFIRGTDPYDGVYYWLKGRYVLEDEDENCDILKLEAGFVTIVPSMHDLTDHKELERLMNIK